MRAIMCTRIKHLSLAALLVWGIFSIIVVSSALEAVPIPPIRVNLKAPDVSPYGAYFQVPVLYKGDSDYPIGGFDLYIRYDTLTMDLRFAQEGSALTNCGWEYFNADISETGFLRLTGVADKGNVPGSPSCFLDGGEDTLAMITFTTPNDATLDCQTRRLEFYWGDCGDNAFSSVSGESLYVAGLVDNYFYGPDPLVVPIVADSLGSGAGLPDSCVALDPDHIIRNVYFESRHLDFICSDSVDLPGDLNLNFIPFELADWIIYRNYFLQGASAFELNFTEQTARSDANNDYIRPTLQDMAYLWTFAVGDIYPFDYDQRIDTVTFYDDRSQQRITFDYSDSLCHVLLIFDGAVAVTTADSTLQLASNQTTYSTNVVISPNFNPPFTGIGQGTSFSYSGIGHLVSAAAADWQNNRLISNVGTVPSCGDADGSGTVSLADALTIIGYIFNACCLPSGLPYNGAAADIDCNGVVTLGDAIKIINYIFAGGPAPCSNCP